MKNATKELIVRRIDDRSEVSRIPVENPSERKVERVMMGMLRNMDTERFFIDDSAFTQEAK
jgi:hypothetical protein